MKRIRIYDTEMNLEEAVVNIIANIKEAQSYVKEKDSNSLFISHRYFSYAKDYAQAVLTYVRELSAGDIKHQAREDVTAKVVTEIKPSDVIIFSFEGVLPKKARDDITADMQKEFPDNRVLLLEMGMKIDVYRIVTERKDEQ